MTDRTSGPAPRVAILASSWRWQATSVLAAGAAIALLFYVGSVAWVALISLTPSDVVPVLDTFGFEQYARLFGSQRWLHTLGNLAFYVAATVLGSVGAGYGLAIGLHQARSDSTALRLMFLLPLATSFVVTGVVWQGLFDPAIGIPGLLRNLGVPAPALALVSRPDTVMWIVASAGIWQQTGLCMSLFTIGLHRIDPAIWRALDIDGAGAWGRYGLVAGPLMKPFFIMAIVFVSASGLRAYDLVVVLTGGGPGFASDVPAHFVIEQIMERQDLALGAAGACVMLALALAATLPYALLSQPRSKP